MKDIQFVPISALKGDNVVIKSEIMDWYQGGTLLYHLENLHIGSDHNHIDCRFPVQTVIRPQSDEFHDFRGYAGRVAGGIFKAGDDVVVLPSGFTSRAQWQKSKFPGGQHWLKAGKGLFRYHPAHNNLNLR